MSVALGFFLAELFILAASVAALVAWKPLGRALAWWQGRHRKRDGLPWRLAWRRWRLRRQRIPRDGRRLELDEEYGWALVLRSVGDKAGTERVAAAEWAAEQAAKEAMSGE